MIGASMSPVLFVLYAVWAALHESREAEREKADRLACEYAVRCYNRKLDQLSDEERGFVAYKVERHLRVTSLRQMGKDARKARKRLRQRLHCKLGITTDGPLTR
jgi:hypothetical protein